MNFRPHLTALHQCRLILRAASWIVPPELRQPWLREWEAEISHYWDQISQPGATHGTQLRLRCCGAFWDAAWFRFNREDLERSMRHLGRSPSFCLVISFGILALVAVSSGMLLRTRAILFPQPYSTTHRVVTISLTTRIESSERAVPYSWIKVWKNDGQIFDEIAGFGWKPKEEMLKTANGRSALSSAQVEDNFFKVFGVQAELGRIFQPDDGRDCSNCILLGYSAWQHWFHADKKIVGEKIRLNDAEAVVLGVLPERFWFPSRDIAIWRVMNQSTADPNASMGVAACLRQGVEQREVESVLERLVTENTGHPLLGFDVEIWGVQERIREPFVLYMFSMGMVLLAASALVRFGPMHLGLLGSGRVVAWRWWAFFAGKTSILLVSLLAAVVEFSPAPYVIGTSKGTFPIESASLWILTIGSMGILRWSLNDQQSRCRKCTQRLVLPARVGDPGCLLLSWAGTELVCEEEHGILHVAETDYCCWLEYRRWTQLDDSWRSPA